MTVHGARAMGTVGIMGGVPYVHTEFAWSLMQMAVCNAQQLESPTRYVHYERAQMSYHVSARNGLVDSMRGDWLLQLDCDHAFDADLTVRMLHRMLRHDIDVLTGVYHTRAWPHLPVIYGWRNEHFERIAKIETHGAEIVRIGAAGGGVLMAKSRVFDRMRAEFDCGPFDIITPYSEDLSFFYRCRELDIPVYTDVRINPSHLATVGIDAADYEQPTDLEYVEAE